VDWAFQRLCNLYASLASQLKALAAAAGFTRISDVTGRTDLLTHLDYDNKPG
jgi:glutamate synthase domain-containing protein 2